MKEIKRHITRNDLLRDGTPRRESVYRPYVTTIGPDMCKFFWHLGRLQKRIHIGPLLNTRSDAELWQPVTGVVE